MIVCPYSYKPRDENKWLSNIKSTVGMLTKGSILMLLTPLKIDAGIKMKQFLVKQEAGKILFGKYGKDPRGCT